MLELPNDLNLSRSHNYVSRDTKNTQQNFTETPCIYPKTQYNEVTKREYRDSSHFSIEKPTFFATIYPKPVNLFNYYREE